MVSYKEIAEQWKTIAELKFDLGIPCPMCKVGSLYIQQNEVCCTKCAVTRSSEYLRGLVQADVVNAQSRGFDWA